MKNKYPNRTSKKFMLSNHTIAELERLAEECGTSMAVIIENAVHHFSYSRKKGE